MGRHNSKAIDNKDRRELVKLLKAKGYMEQNDRGKGGHSVYKNIETGKIKVLTINMNKMAARRIAKELMMGV